MSAQLRPDYFVSDESDEPILPEQRLFLAVIMEAIRDATAPSKDRSKNTLEVDQHRARRWFEDDGVDFRMTCSLAGVHHENVRKGVLAYLADGNDRLPNRCATRPKTGERSNVAAIAARSNLSHGAVRKFLKDADSVLPTTRARILAAMQDLDAESRTNGA